MIKKQVIFSAIIAVLVLFTPMVFAVEFGPDSANITNRYFPAKVGAWNVMVGDENWTGNVIYFHVIGVDVVSGAKIDTQTLNNVKCLKVNRIHTDVTGVDEIVILWMAQDTDGNVWILKVEVPFDDQTYLLGTVFTSWMMPAVPASGVSAGITIPETDTDYCQIVDVGVSVDTSFGNYESCIEVNCFHQESNTEVEYYCPDVGNVRISTQGSPTDVMDLKESGTATVTRAVVIPMWD